MSAPASPAVLAGRRPRAVRASRMQTRLLELLNDAHRAHPGLGSTDYQEVAAQGPLAVVVWVAARVLIGDTAPARPDRIPGPAAVLCSPELLVLDPAFAELFEDQARDAARRRLVLLAAARPDLAHLLPAFVRPEGG